MRIVNHAFAPCVTTSTHPGTSGAMPLARCRAGIQALAGLAAVTTFTCVITISANYLGAIARRLGPGRFRWVTGDAFCRAQGSTTKHPTCRGFVG
jgi:hypothetical protein